MQISFFFCFDIFEPQKKFIVIDTKSKMEENSRMESSPQTSSSDVSTNGDGNNELGKQIVDLVKRLINEADPETEKIQIEFTFTKIP